MPTSILRIALLHLAAIPGDLETNRRLIQTAVTSAGGLHAKWILTPELCITGYDFADQIGTDWILPQPDAWMADFCRLVKQLRVIVFLSHPERDRRTQKLYNSLFVIAPNGAIAGKHRKVHVLRVGAESWSSPGDGATPIVVPPTKVGVLICADAFSPKMAQHLQAGGARVLVSAAAWPPGLHGPNGEWERCTSETGLPLFVCNRTGADRVLNFTDAESVVVKEGRRLVSFRSERSAILLIDWDLATQTLVAHRAHKV
jgi:predicted amidohydrolase